MGAVRKSRFKVSKTAKITDFMDICVRTDSSKVEIGFLIDKLELMCLIRANTARGRAGLSPACPLPAVSQGLWGFECVHPQHRDRDVAPKPHPKAGSAPRVTRARAANPPLQLPTHEITIARTFHAPLPSSCLEQIKFLPNQAVTVHVRCGSKC